MRFFPQFLTLQKCREPEPPVYKAYSLRDGSVPNSQTAMSYFGTLQHLVPFNPTNNNSTPKCRNDQYENFIKMNVYFFHILFI